VQLQLPGVAHPDLEALGEEHQRGGRQHPQRPAATDHVREGADHQRHGHQRQQRSDEAVRRDRVDVAGEVTAGEHRLGEHGDQVPGEQEPQRPEREPWPRGGGRRAYKGVHAEGFYR
jgi:hypothetical protein